MPAASNDTYSGALQVLMRQLSEMKLLPDVNLPFVVGLETQVIAEARSPERMMQDAGLLPQQAMNPMGMDALGLPPGAGPPGAPMGPGGMGAPPPSQMGAGVPGVMTSPGGPNNPDELRRALAAPR